MGYYSICKKEGEKQLPLEVYRWSAGSYLECQDMWRLSGIERDIYLYSTPKQYIADYQVTSTLDKETYTDGLFALETTIGGEAEGAATLSYRLEDACGKTILEKGLSGSKQGKRQFHFF